MKILKKFYLIKGVNDKTQKPRLFASDDNLAYGDFVKTYSKDNRIDNGYVIGTIMCSDNTIKNLVNTIGGGYYPLAKCEKAEVL